MRIKTTNNTDNNFFLVDDNNNNNNNINSNKVKTYLHNNQIYKKKTR